MAEFGAAAKFTDLSLQIPIAAKEGGKNYKYLI